MALPTNSPAPVVSLAGSTSREAFEEEFDGAPEAPREPGEPSARELCRLTFRPFFSAGIGLLA